MRKFKIFVLFIFMIVPVYSLTKGENKNEEVSNTYWRAVKNNDVIMTDEEYIEKYSSICPVWMRLHFYSNMEIDGTYYGNFWIESGDFGKNRIEMSAGKPDVSEKRIKDGLYDGLYPMVKTETGRDDIKYLWHPATNCTRCIFFKFSIDNYTSEWISVVGVPKTKDVKKSVFNTSFDTKISASLEKPEASDTFKIEGIRVIYDCDYDLIISNLHEAYNFVNDDKEHSPKFVEAGAKYMELKNSIFDYVCYYWRSQDDKEDRNFIEITSYDKLNFEDEMTIKSLSKKNQLDNYLKIREKLENPRIMPTVQTVDKIERDYYVSLVKEVEESDTGVYKTELLEEANRLLYYFDEQYRLAHPSKKNMLKKLLK